MKQLETRRSNVTLLIVHCYVNLVNFTFIFLIIENPKNVKVVELVLKGSEIGT